ncbi:MAG TPA: hypothetical protein VIO81_03185 [Methyloversatilis sp.]
MWLFLLESGTALALFLFILWWTRPRNHDESAHTEPPKALTDKKDGHDQP